MLINQRPNNLSDLIGSELQQPTIALEKQQIGLKNREVCAPIQLSAIARLAPVQPDLIAVAKRLVN